jgi:hypothetical protein
MLASSALAACGGSGSGAQHASGLASKTADDAFVFAKCMREHGVHVEASTPAPGTIKLGISGNINPRRMKAAQHACRKYAPATAAKRRLTPGERVAREEALLKFAKCMREHGVRAFPDPNSGGQLTHGMLSDAGINDHEPSVLRAADACAAVTHGIITKTTVARFAAGH